MAVASTLDRASEGAPVLASSTCSACEDLGEGWWRPRQNRLGSDPEVGRTSFTARQHPRGGRPEGAVGGRCWPAPQHKSDSGTVIRPNPGGPWAISVQRWIRLRPENHFQHGDSAAFHLRPRPVHSPRGPPSLKTPHVSRTSRRRSWTPGPQGPGRAGKPGPSPAQSQCRGHGLFAEQVPLKPDLVLQVTDSEDEFISLARW